MGKARNLSAVGFEGEFRRREDVPHWVWPRDEDDARQEVHGIRVCPRPLSSEQSTCKIVKASYKTV